MKIPTYKNWKIGVAVSGGADSMTLLDLYAKAGQDIIVINIEHGIRGQSSIDDSQFVKTYCAERGIPCLAFCVNAKEEAKKNKISIELAARKLRYEIFDKLLQEKKVDKIALAHHANDNMETMLMRIFRGTGLRGIVGIKDRGHYIHPLLKYRRQQIEQYAEQNNIPYVIDETNVQNKYCRNYTRNKIVPVIKKKFGDVEAAFTRLSENAQEIENYLESQIVKYQKKGDKYFLNDIFSHAKLIQKYSIQKIIYDMGGVQDIESRHYSYIMSLEKKPLNTTINLPFNIIAVRTSDGLVFSYHKDYSTFCSQFFAEKKYKYAGFVYSFAAGKKIINGISFDLDKVPEGTVIRTRKKGDKFKRVNGKTKLLSDYLTDAKINVLDKQKLLVMAKDSEVFAVLGMETGDKVKIDQTTKHIMHIIKEKEIL
ncbi:MAG: tRNA lysidine(34) synthetase TilS [Clostridiales bacterium]|nr:tRNA lysidine(34) synthetase TilS [Clostridiales bacterium]